MTSRDSEPGVLDSGESESIRSLVRRAGAAEDEPVDLLAGVQRKLRKRSGGKFYADGWSTARQPPIMTYLITSLIMLAVVLAAYVTLRPFAGEAVSVPMTPAPVRVLPPPRSR